MGVMGCTWRSALQPKGTLRVTLEVSAGIEGLPLRRSLLLLLNRILLEAQLQISLLSILHCAEQAFLILFVVVGSMISRRIRIPAIWMICGLIWSGMLSSCGLFIAQRQALGDQQS